MGLLSVSLFIVLTLKSVRASLSSRALLTLYCHTKFHSVLCPRGGSGAKRTKREMKVRVVVYGESRRKLPDMRGWCPGSLNNVGEANTQILQILAPKKIRDAPDELQTRYRARENSGAQ